MLVSLSDDVKEQLTDAAQQTNKAYSAVRKGREGDGGEGAKGPFQESIKSCSVGSYLAPEIVTVEPILRFLQLLCENHNSDMQVFFLSLFLVINFKILKFVLFSLCFPITISSTN